MLRIAAFFCLLIGLGACAAPGNKPAGIDEPGTPETVIAHLNDSTNTQILTAIYGNYEENTGALLSDKQYAEIPKRIGDVFFEDGATLYSNITYKHPLPDGRLLFATETRPAADKHECHVCSVVSGAGILKESDGRWDLTQFDYFTAGGVYGIRPDYGVQEIGKGDFALTAQYADLHMGVVWSNIQLYDIKNNFGMLFQIITESDNKGG